MDTCGKAEHVALCAVWEQLLKDVRYGFRILAARPGFTAVAVLSIALGIAATTAIVSVVYAVLIDPYPYHAADRIGQLILVTKKYGRWGPAYSKAQYLDVKSRARSMEDAVAVDQGEAVRTETGRLDSKPEPDADALFFRKRTLRCELRRSSHIPTTGLAGSP